MAKKQDLEFALGSTFFFHMMAAGIFTEDINRITLTLAVLAVNWQLN